MGPDSNLKREVMIVAVGVVCGVLAAITAMMLHAGKVEGILSIPYALLMSGMYYIWIPLETIRRIVAYLILCALTGYIFGFLEVLFLS